MASVLTSVCLLLNRLLNGALVRNAHLLLCDGTASIIEAFGLVHGALKRVALPAKHVIGVGASCGTLEAPYVGVGCSRGPHAVELRRVPNSFESDLYKEISVTSYSGLDSPIKSPKGTNLWHADRVSGWARARVDEPVLGDGVVHMRLVVWTVEVLAVPASNSN